MRTRVIRRPTKKVFQLKNFKFLLLLLLLLFKIENLPSVAYVQYENVIFFYL